MKEQQQDLEEKLQASNQLKEQVALLERRCSLMTAEKDELKDVLDLTDRARKSAEHELVEVSERVNVLSTQVLQTWKPFKWVKRILGRFVGSGQFFFNWTFLCRTQVW